MMRLRRNCALTMSRSFRVAAHVVLAGVGMNLLAACSTVLSEMPTQMGGLPTGVPARPETAPVYPAVHDMPPPRTAAVLTEEERKKVEADLAAIRAAQERRANSQPAD